MNEDLELDLPIQVAVEATVALAHLHDEAQVPMRQLKDSEQTSREDTGRGGSQTTWGSIFECPQCGTRAIGETIIKTDARVDIVTSP